MGKFRKFGERITEENNRNRAKVSHGDCRRKSEYTEDFEHLEKRADEVAWSPVAGMPCWFWASFAIVLAWIVFLSAVS